MAMAAPNFQAVANALASAQKIYETIDRVPPIDSASTLGDRPDDCVGQIELQDIHFIYPSRPGVDVLTNYSVTFEKGKMTAREFTIASLH